MSIQLTKLIADFDTQLAAPVAIGDTTATLVSVTDDDGNTIPNGTYGFTIDAGNSSKEYIICTVTSTAITAVYSASRQGVATSGFARSHRRGAKVTITDWSAIKGIQNVLEVGYASATTPTTDYMLATKKYVDDASFAGATNASTTTPGVVELPTQAEVDAKTASGGLGPLAVTPDTLRATKYNDAVASATGTDAYAITVVPAITAYATYQEFSFIADVANTGACTLNVSGLGAKTIKKDVSTDTVTGDILAGQTVKVMYDGTNMQLVSKTPAVPVIPVVNVYDTVSTEIGSSTTQFDITNPAGTTFRYTFDGTGTDPNISLANNPVGSLINFQAQNFTAANNGVFIVTGAGANYVEVTNASGVAENDKTIGTGYVVRGTSTWTKPAGLKYVTVEVQAGGGGGGSTTTATVVASGGGGGGYTKKIIAASALNSTEYFLVGAFGTGGNGTGGDGTSGKESAFSSSLLYTTGGVFGRGNGDNGGIGGRGFNGTINIGGQGGGAKGTGTSGGSGMGGSSFLGGGGQGYVAGTDSNSGGVGLNPGTGYGGGGGGASTSGPDAVGGVGTKGCVILTEYYG